MLQFSTQISGLRSSYLNLRGTGDVSNLDRPTQLFNDPDCLIHVGTELQSVGCAVEPDFGFHTPCSRLNESGQVAAERDRCRLVAKPACCTRVNDLKTARRVVEQLNGLRDRVPSKNGTFHLEL